MPIELLFIFLFLILSLIERYLLCSSISQSGAAETQNDTKIHFTFLFQQLLSSFLTTEEPALDGVIVLQ
jgi:hypothetical protein